VWTPGVNRFTALTKTQRGTVKGSKGRGGCRKCRRRRLLDVRGEAAALGGFDAFDADDGGWEAPVSAAPPHWAEPQPLRGREGGRLTALESALLTEEQQMRRLQQNLDDQTCSQTNLTLVDWSLTLQPVKGGPAGS
jgi:hypothetical protein